VQPVSFGVVSWVIAFDAQAENDRLEAYPTGAGEKTSLPDSTSPIQLRPLELGTVPQLRANDEKPKDKCRRKLEIPKFRKLAIRPLRFGLSAFPSTFGFRISVFTTPE
jgi:hypothetical protein